MKILISLLVALQILSSCTDKSNQKIEGVWLGYERSFVLNNDTLVEDFHLILSIGKDSIQGLNFKYITDGNRDSITNSSYKLSDNNLIFAQDSNSFTLKYELLDENTLILSSEDTKYRYTKLRKEYTKEWNLDFAGKIFTISDSSMVIDTIEFLDNETILTYNSELERPTHVLEWRIREYSGYKFFIIDSHEIPVFLLTNEAGNNFKLTREPNDQQYYYLRSKEFETRFNRNGLIGEWKGKSNKPENNLRFIFDIDSLQMNDITAGKMIKSYYSLNLTGEKILCYNYVTQNLMIYRINNLNEESISLTRISSIRDSFTLAKKK
ncbi:MAG: hypothetical protein CVT94_12600 [Bacteroidetes bacterium HGW-Bacteroidetes-11]|jgi:hypothetical protein|nr:MAG: hypothetical protein CVT94_12600 [Bacteroidetes bacterium HGW-Bacteroidetes-11]